MFVRDTTNKQARGLTEQWLVPNVFDPVNRMFGHHFAPMFMLHTIDESFYLQANYPQSDEFSLYLDVLNAAQGMRHEVSSLMHKKIHGHIENKMKMFLPDDDNKNIIVVAFSFIYSVCYPESLEIFDMLGYRQEMKELEGADFTIKSSGPGFVSADCYEQFKESCDQPRMILLCSEKSDDYRFLECNRIRRFDA